MQVLGERCVRTVAVYVDETVPSHVAISSDETVSEFLY